MINFHYNQPLPFHKLTEIDIEASPYRHIEALWAEIASLKEEIKALKEKINGMD